MVVFLLDWNANIIIMAMDESKRLNDLSQRQTAEAATGRSITGRGKGLCEKN